jgi:cell division transport system permease protein
MVLLLLGIVGLLILNAQVLSRYVKENLCFSVIIKDNVKEPDIKLFQKTLDTQPFIRSTEYITKEQAAKSLQEELGEDFVGTLGFNPLSPAIKVYLDSEYANPDSIAALEKFFLSKSDIVSEVSYQKNLIHEININVRKISLILLFFCGILFVISFALLNNTIRLMIYSKRFTINTMKLVGATNNFIRKPFLISGALQGFYSSIIAIILLSVLFYFTNKQLGEMVSLMDYKIIAVLYLIVILCGITLSTVSTYFSINKYLKQKSFNLYY